MEIAELDLRLGDEVLAALWLILQIATLIMARRGMTK